MRARTCKVAPRHRVCYLCKLMMGYAMIAFLIHLRTLFKVEDKLGATSLRLLGSGIAGNFSARDGDPRL